jgi:uncharacterized RDD family membrane protein YckC
MDVVQPEEQVVTGEAVALGLQLAGAGSRCVAALIDFGVTVVATLLVFILVAVTGFDSTDAVVTVIIVTEVLIVLGYPVAMETLWRGRTLGKAAMGLRVVRDDGGPIRFRHAFVRGITGVVVDKPGITYGLGALIPIIATARKKRLGDMAAGTMVLQERVPGKLEAPVMMPPPLTGWAAGLDLTAVDDALALRIRHFLTRAKQLLPEARATLEHQLASEVVGRVGQPPADTPGWAILTAVLAERRRRAFAATQPATTYPPSTLSSEPATTGAESAAPPVSPPPSGFAPPG